MILLAFSNSYLAKTYKRKVLLLNKFKALLRILSLIMFGVIAALLLGPSHTAVNCVLAYQVESCVINIRCGLNLDFKLEKHSESIDLRQGHIRVCAVAFLHSLMWD